MSGPHSPQGSPRQPGQGGWSAGPDRGPYGGGAYRPTPQTGRSDGQFGAPQPPYLGTSRYGQHGHRVRLPAAHPGPGGTAYPGQQGYPGQPGGDGWGGPPRRRRTALIIWSLVGAAILLGGLVVVVLLAQRGGNNGKPEIPVVSRTAPQIPIPTTRGGPPTGRSTSGSADGDAPSLPVQAVAGDCVGQDAATHQTEVQPCGAPTSIFTVAKTPSSPVECPKGYARAHGTNNYLCLTLDVKAGDCADASNMKTDCASPKATTRVVQVQPGPKTAASCVGVPGATRATLTGPEPAKVACLGSKS